ncbi:hypothetical protein L7F22_062737 [Adiantum nelumboides]|nr:hypothetical protein [Adiantum nelumboides]
MTSKEKFTRKKLNVSHFKLFGCIAYVHVPNELRMKLDPTVEKCVFIGYFVEQKGYKCYNYITRRVRVSRDVVFAKMATWYVDVKDDIGTDVNKSVAENSDVQSQVLSGPQGSPVSSHVANPWSGRLRKEVSPASSINVSRKGMKMPNVTAGHDDVDGHASGSKHSLDEKLGIPSVRTTGVRKLHAENRAPDSNAEPHRSGRNRYLVDREWRRSFSQPAEALYRKLGLSRGASLDEVKQAYRRRALECHPDLHHNDGSEFRHLTELYNQLINRGGAYHRRYVRKFAEIASSLHMLTQKGVPFLWGVTENSFEVYYDACGRSLGAVLMQEGRVIAYESRMFSKPEMTAQIYEKELLAVIHALTQWRHYLLEADFTVFTDNQSSRYFLSQKQLSKKQMRWANILSQFHFQIVHVQGQKNVMADALSRKPLVQAISAIHHSTFEDMVDQYATDTDFADIFTRIRDGETVAGYSLQEGYLM